MTEYEIRDVFSRNVRALREKKDLSQMALAEKSSLATNFINDIENGKKWFSPATLAKLCDALDVKPYKLFLEFGIDGAQNNELMSQFCAELSDDIINTIRDVSARYGHRGRE